MNQKPATFKFSLIGDDGSYIDDQGVLGSLGFAKKYSGTTADEDLLVVALRQATINVDLEPNQKVLLRSFLAAWLNGKQKRLGQVAAFAIQLPRSVSFLSQVGFLDRTATIVARTGIAIASCALYLDLSWDVATTNLSTVSGADATLMIGKQVAAGIAFVALPECVLIQIQKDFGKPGSPLSRAAFSSEPVHSMLRMCSLRSVLTKLNLDSDSMSQLKNQLDRRFLLSFSPTVVRSQGFVCQVNRKLLQLWRHTLRSRLDCTL